MTRDDIIRMAREAKLPYEYDTARLLYLTELERFAALVAAAEGEACSKLVEQYTGAWDDQGYALAQAIRARGEK
jgi:hypothetical protein